MFIEKVIYNEDIIYYFLLISSIWYSEIFAFGCRNVWLKLNTARGL